MKLLIAFGAMLVIAGCATRAGVVVAPKHPQADHHNHQKKHAHSHCHKRVCHGHGHGKRHHD